MAIRVTDEYPGRVVAPNADYQDGSIQNETVPDSSDDGTPLDELWGNDIEGMKQRAFLMAGRTPSGLSDTALFSDIMDSLIDITAPFKVQPLSVAVMQVRVAPGAMGDSIKAEQTSAVISAPTVNPRIDVITVSLIDGSVGVVTGAEAASPSVPEVPADSQSLAQITLAVAQTSIVDDDILDARSALNDNLTSVDLRANTLTHNMTADSDYTLIVSENRKGRLVITDTGVLLTAARNILIADTGRAFFVQNDTAQVITFKTVSGTGVSFQPGTAGQLFCDGTNVLSPLPFLAPPLLHIQDQKASGTHGGGFSSGSYQTRDLTIAVTNEISGASLSANQVTLPKGTYFVDAALPAYAVDTHKGRLYNVTDVAQEVNGTSEASDSSGATGTVTFVRGRFTITATKVFELQHICANTKTINGFGVDAGSGTNIYSDVMITKIS